MAYTYVGAELDLFAQARTWKSYVRRHVRPYLGREVLEVGAGSGGTTHALCDGKADRWVCLEPDAALGAQVIDAIAAGRLPDCCVLRTGTLADLDEHERFDTLLYMDVLEHIEDDRSELVQAAARLRSGGHLVVLAPAHAWLFSPFDGSIGHYRRYTRRTLREASPEALDVVKLVYLDAVGLLASLGNRLVLRSTMPTEHQVVAWDRWMVPLSRMLDPLAGYTVGKSVLGVWRRV